MTGPAAAVRKPARLAVVISATLFAHLSTNPASGQVTFPDLAPADRVDVENSSIAQAFDTSVACGTTERRNSVAQLNWVTEKARVAALRLDVTTYKDGFASGRYLTTKLGPEVKLVSSVGFEPGPGSGLDIRIEPPEFTSESALKGLKLEKFRPEINRTRSFRSSEAIAATVRIEDLGPGITYFVRIVHERASALPVPSETILIESPRCAADEAEERQ